MKHKGKVLELFVEWKRNMEKSTRKKIKVRRSDNGGEYTKSVSNDVCKYTIGSLIQVKSHYFSYFY